MLLQSVVAKLDAELKRLQELRRIVNGISSISPLDGLSMKLELNRLNQLKQSMTVSLLAPENVGLLNSAGLRPVQTPKRGRHPESRALTSTIPATPVVVYAAQVASERQRRVPARSVSGAKMNAARFLAKSRTEATPSIDALRNRWLAEG